jgi:hypothetical protein
VAKCAERNEGERRDAELLGDLDGERHQAIGDNACHRRSGSRP